ncbi:MAG: hypothetical protein M3454_01255 [Actinomycetota bacterium]|nr:hypothetical protein [Actinomycetota bacterium]
MKFAPPTRSQPAGTDRRRITLRLLLAVEFQYHLDQFELAVDTSAEHLTVDVVVGVDTSAARTQPESGLHTLAGRERLDPRLEVASAAHQVDPSVAQVLDRHDVVVVRDRLQTHNAA